MLKSAPAKRFVPPNLVTQNSSQSPKRKKSVDVSLHTPSHDDDDDDDEEWSMTTSNMAEFMSEPATASVVDTGLKQGPASPVADYQGAAEICSTWHNPVFETAPTRISAVPLTRQSQL